MAELLDHPLPLRVRFQSERLNVRGVGVVRYCKSAGGKYVVGVEFAEDLHWQAPEGEVNEPIPLCDPQARI